MNVVRKKLGQPPRVQASMDFGDGHAIQVLDLASGIHLVVEGGRAIDHPPADRGKTVAPPDAGLTEGGERTGSGKPNARTADEQTWFRNTFCNGAQACVQAWDWTFSQTDHAVGHANGVGWVGSEGTNNATFTVSIWECVCSGPFCIGGEDCFWVVNWSGVIVPGNYLSLDTNSTGSVYVRWELAGAGGGTQVSFAARY
ncbi:hypothetical protein AB0C81_17900 [Streptomyces roseoverticillatus]|uniref:hypothetical protein n=1 Tax=Streptomyces roseoverticillatus TaxID=66429 RepID=UPI0033CFA510